MTATGVLHNSTVVLTEIATANVVKASFEVSLVVPLHVKNSLRSFRSCTLGAQLSSIEGGNLGASGAEKGGVHGDHSSDGSHSRPPCSEGRRLLRLLTGLGSIYWCSSFALYIVVERTHGMFGVQSKIMGGFAR